MTKSWFFGVWHVELRHKKGNWHWNVGRHDATAKSSGKNKDEAIALNEALDALSRLSVMLRAER